MSAFKVKANNTSGGGSELAPAGAHPAVLVAIVDLGTHEEDYKGKKYDARKVFLAWELTAEKMAGTDCNHVVGCDFSLTFGKKSRLRLFVEKWRGKEFNDNEEFELPRILGKPCLLTLVHKTSTSSGNTYAKVDSVTALPRGMTVAAAKRAPLCWELQVGCSPPEETWLPYLYGEPLGDVIRASKEWAMLERGEDPGQQAAAAGAGPAGAVGAGAGAGGLKEVPF